VPLNCAAGICDLPGTSPWQPVAWLKNRGFWPVEQADSARPPREACSRGTLRSWADQEAKPLTAIFDGTARHYGRSEMERFRLHIWGGCFNHRLMRGGKALSTHSCGAAVDLDPERNQLPWGRDRAALARPDHDAFWTIVEAHGATSLGRAANRDWMHFQFARL